MIYKRFGCGYSLRGNDEVFGATIHVVSRNNFRTVFE